MRHHRIFSEGVSNIDRVQWVHDRCVFENFQTFPRVVYSTTAALVKNANKNQWPDIIYFQYTHTQTFARNEFIRRLSFFIMLGCFENLLPTKKRCSFFKHSKGNRFRFASPIPWFQTLWPTNATSVFPLVSSSNHWPRVNQFTLSSCVRYDHGKEIDRPS